MFNDLKFFIMLVGVAGSGKSRLAKELSSTYNAIHLSSDSIRLELFNDEKNQDNNTEVFEEMNNRARSLLYNGKNVIYDATNINRKRRTSLIQSLPKHIRKIVYYVSTDYRKIISQNLGRSRVVPEDIINKMYKSLQIPIYSEGWNDIFIHHSTSNNDIKSKIFANSIRRIVLNNSKQHDIMSFLAMYFDDFFNIYNVAQDSKYHSFSISNHTYYTYEYIFENYKPVNKRDMEIMLWTALLHDIGKPFCKSFIGRNGERSRYANFIGHEFVGSQIAVRLLNELRFDDAFIHKVATLIQFHMHLLNENANKKKLKNRVGEDNFNKLVILREADTSSH